MRLLYVLIFIIPLNIHGKHIKSVNAIIGDESFIHTFQRSANYSRFRRSKN